MQECIRNVSVSMFKGMLIKFYCLMPVYSYFYYLKKSGSGSPRLVAVVCSLNVLKLI